MHIIKNFKKNFEIKTEKDFLEIIILGIIIIFIFKILSIFIYSGRGVDFIDYPYQTLGWVRQDRFTDFLIPLQQSLNESPYYDHPGMATGGVYGFITYFFLKISYFLFYNFLFSSGNFLKLSYYIFFFYLLLFILIFYRIGRITFKCNTFKRSIIYCLAFLICCHPLYFAIDRGNTDIIVASLLLFIFYLNIKKIYKYNWLILSLIACSKITYLFFLLPVFFMPKKFIFYSLSIIFFNYLIPILIYDHLSLNYLFENIFKLGGVNYAGADFCNNIQCGIRSIGIAIKPSFSRFITYISILLLLVTVLYKQKYCKFQIIEVVFFFLFALFFLILKIRFNYHYAPYGIFFLLLFFIFYFFIIRNTDYDQKSFFPSLFFSMSILNFGFETTNHYRNLFYILIFFYYIYNFDINKKIMNSIMAFSFICIFSFPLPLPNYPFWFNFLKSLSILIMLFYSFCLFLNKPQIIKFKLLKC